MRANGINDLGELARQGEPSLEEIFGCYEEVVVAIRNRLPHVPLCTANEMPTTGQFACCVPFVLPLNAHIQRVAEKHGCLHVDFYGEVVGDGGELRSELTYDGLHLNDEGYGLLANRLKEVLPTESQEPCPHAS
jgi:hypothetical protein